MNSQRIANKMGSWLKKSSPTILTWLGVIGVGATIVLTVRATFKAAKELEEAKQVVNTPAEKVIVTWKYYIPPALTGVATISCILGANVLNKRQQAILASGYAMLHQAYTNYRKTLIDLHGEEADAEVRAAMAREYAEYHQINLDTPDQKVIFYDEFSERTIERYEREIIDAEYHFNRNFVMHGYATLNDLYYFLGLDATNYGAEYGWSMSSGIMWVDFEHSLIEEDDGGTPVYLIGLPWPPDHLEPWEM